MDHYIKCYQNKWGFMTLKTVSSILQQNETNKKMMVKYIVLKESLDFLVYNILMGKLININDANNIEITQQCYSAVWWSDL